MQNLEDHPLADLFPLMPDDELVVLASDILANEQREPIWLFEGKILDGRNRYRACLAVELDPLTKPYIGDDPLGFVISKNLHRRHLTESQRGMVAANIATAKRGGDRVSDQPANLPVGPEVTQADAARKLRISERTVRGAVKIKAMGVPELVKSGESGDASVSAAAEVSALPAAEQRDTVKAGKIKEKAKEQREKRKPRAPGSDSESVKKTVTPESERQSTKAVVIPPADADPADEFVSGVETLCRDVDQIVARARALKDSPYGYSMHLDSAVAQIIAARKTLWQGRPAHPCPYCRVNETNGCKTCNMTGRVKKTTYDSGVEAVGGAA